MDTPASLDNPNVKPLGKRRVRIYPAARALISWFVLTSLFLMILLALAIGLFAWVGGGGVLGGFVFLFLFNVVVLVHLLGHLLAARCFNVQVLSLSIGLGPAVPWCRFVLGGTLFKVGVLPLGGWVRLVRRGTDVGMGADYPRALCNRPLWQQALIRGAGVGANLVLAAGCFIAITYKQENVRITGVVGTVDAGSSAWMRGVRSGWILTRVEDKENPSFEDLTASAELTTNSRPLEVEFCDGKSLDRVPMILTPRWQENQPRPTVGIGPSERLQLVARTQANRLPLPVLPGSAAAAARTLELEPDEVIQATTDPDAPDRLKALPYQLNPPQWDYEEFGRRLRRLRDRAVRIQTQHGERVLTTGFAFEDQIIASSERNAEGTYDPMRQQPVPGNLRNVIAGMGDPFLFRRRLEGLTAQPIVVTVRRKDSEGTLKAAHVFVPPAYYRVFPGMRMTIGEIAAIRHYGPADLGGVHPHITGRAGDVLQTIALKTEAGEELFRVSVDRLDPLRLPTQLRQAAARRPGTKLKAHLEVLRPISDQDATLRAVSLVLDWDDNWASNREVLNGPRAPMPIAELGLAYWVRGEVAAVDAQSPAARAGLLPGDQIVAMRARVTTREGAVTWGSWMWLVDPLHKNAAVSDHWAFFFSSLQTVPWQEIQLRVHQHGDQPERLISLTLAEDESWPFKERGWMLMNDTHIQCIESLRESMRLGIVETLHWDRTMVTRARALPSISQYISLVVLTSALTDQDAIRMIGFLVGVLSLNLACLNVLPLPLTDAFSFFAQVWRRFSFPRRRPGGTASPCGAAKEVVATAGTAGEAPGVQ